MPLYTITNVPPVEPSWIAETATLVTAVGAVIAILVWPILVGYTLFLFRNPISRFIDRIKAAKGFGVDLDADVAGLAVITEVVKEEAAEDEAEGVVTDTAAKAELEPAAETSNGSTVTPRHSSMEDDFSIWRRWLQTDSSENLYSSRNLVQFSWMSVDRAIKRLGAKYGMAGRSETIIKVLAAKKILSPTLAILLSKLLQYKDDAVQGRDFSRREAQQIRSSAQTAIREINELVDAAPPPVSPPSEPSAG